MEIFLITHGIAFVVGFAAAILFALWQPELFGYAEDVTGSVTGIGKTTTTVTTQTGANTFISNTVVTSNTFPIPPLKL